MTKVEMFDKVLDANARYVKAVENALCAEVQESLLDECRVKLRAVIDAGLAVEYQEYCEMLGSRRHRV